MRKDEALAVVVKLLSNVEICCKKFKKYFVVKMIVKWRG